MTVRASMYSPLWKQDEAWEYEYAVEAEYNRLVESGEYDDWTEDEIWEEAERRVNEYLTARAEYEAERRFEDGLDWGPWT